MIANVFKLIYNNWLIIILEIANRLKWIKQRPLLITSSFSHMGTLLFINYLHILFCPLSAIFLIAIDLAKYHFNANFRFCFLCQRKNEFPFSTLKKRYHSKRRFQFPFFPIFLCQSLLINHSIALYPHFTINEFH